MHTMRILIIVALSGLILPLSARTLAQDNGSERKSAETFDTDDNDEIGLEEYKNVLRHVYVTEKHPVIDRNGDGKISQDESDAYKQGLEEFLEVYTKNFDEPRTLRAVNNAWFWVEGVSATWPPQLLIRRSYEDDDLPSTLSPKQFQELKGALFSFERDFEGRADTWIARGAIIYRFDDIEDKDKKNSLRLTPSISFDRVANDSDDGTEVDALTGRVGTQYKHEFKKGSFLDILYLRGNLTYETDFDLESSLIATEFQLEPVKGALGMGISQHVPFLESFLDYRLRAILHLEYGEVMATGSKADLVDRQDFFRWGPKLELALFSRMENLQGLSFVVKYEYLDGPTGDPGHSDLFEASMSWAFDREGHLALDLSYRNGEVTLGKVDTETLTIGLDVKF